jgi:hypothetical protein
VKQWLSNPTFYHYARQVMTLGLPFRRFVREFGLDDPTARVADLGCGPVDLLRYLTPDKRPAMYLGLDVSDRYLNDARRRAASLNMPSTFEAFDLTRLADSESHCAAVAEKLTAGRVDRALLLGVLHHIDDHSALATLETLSRVPTLQRVFTWDVLITPGRNLNNFLARHDRGEFVRTEAAYDALLNRSVWRVGRKFWTRPGLAAVKYLHYELVRP